jgi:hypothetical protein
MVRTPKPRGRVDAKAAKVEMPHMAAGHRRSLVRRLADVNCAAGEARSRPSVDPGGAVCRSGEKPEEASQNRCLGFGVRWMQFL